MVKVLIAYYSHTGNTRKMAEMIQEGAKEEGAEVTLKKIEEMVPKELLHYDTVIFGSPTYYGSYAYQLKKLLDESVQFHGKMEGKVAGAFTSSALVGGGNETTLLDILHACLIHGMVILGVHNGDHYGPVSIGTPDQRVKKECLSYGKKLVKLTAKLK